LDDALDKLARRDELRRRAVGEATGTPPAVQELVEAIATVVGRNQGLEVTVGVEGAGDPTLLHFFVEEGVVRVTADSAVASRVTEPRHADFDLDAEEPATPAPAAAPTPSFDDQDRFDPGTGYEPSVYDVAHAYDDENTDDIDPSRFRSPFAATPPPPVPPQTARPEPSAQAQPHAAAHDPQPFFAGERPAETNGFGDRPADAGAGFGEETARLAYGQQPPVPDQRAAAEPQRGMPTPLPEPIPLRNVDSQETEQAAKRLAALLRDDPSLLRQERP
jgi:hypothetical protein